MAVVTLYRKKGNVLADKFRGTYGDPGTPLSEWERLMMDKNLIEKNIKLTVVEFINHSDLPSDVKSKENAFITFKSSQDESRVIIKSITAKSNYNEIKPWIESLNGVEVEVITPIEITNQTSTNNDNNVEVVRAPAAPKTPSNTISPQDVIATTKSNTWIGQSIGASILVAGCMALGFVGGSLISINEMEETDSLLVPNYAEIQLVQEDGTVARFSAKDDAEWCDRPPKN